jgi:5'(3')-deoxyribonucleotidase
MRILVDLDGVAADFYGSFLRLYNEEFNNTLTPEDIVSWELTPDIYTGTTREHLRTYFDRHGFWSNIEPMPGAIKALKYLHLQGHELRIVTAVPIESQRACYEKIHWVREHLPFIGLDEFHATKDKAGVRGDILFDDAPHNIRDFPGLTCVMDAAYNQDAEADFRVNSWESFIKVIEGIINASNV